MALNSKGTQLWFLNKTTGALTRLRCAKSIDIPRGSRAQVDTTCLEDEFNTYLGGTVDPGAGSVVIDPDPRVGGHKELDALYQSGVNVDWAAGWSDGPNIAPTSVRGVGSVTITNGGSGYTSAPTVGATGGGGTGFAATAEIENGVVVAVTVTNPGTGYTSAPTLSFTGGAGSGAAATANLEYRISAPTTRTWTLFNGYVADFPFSHGVNAAVNSNVSIQISGATTWQPKTT